MLFILLFLLVVFVMLLKVFAIISGYGSKVLGSGVFVCGRKPEDIIVNELGFFPINLGRYSVDVTKSIATGSVLGLAKKKTLYRNGLGATLINGLTEAELRTQALNLPAPP